MKRPLHVLVLDDDDKILRLLKIFLRQLGYSVTTALNGREGIQMMLENSFDLIIVDIQMPVIDGFEFAEEALGLWPWEKIIFCTGNITSQVKRKATSLGINTILEKPLSFNTLETAIQEVCGSSDALAHESGSLSQCDIGCELSLLRSFTHEVVAHNHFGKTITDFSKVIHQIIPCAAAGVFGMEGDYRKLSVYADAPLSPALQDKIAQRIQSHMEFFSGESLPGMPPCEIEIRAPKAEVLQAPHHYVLMSPVAGKREAKGLLFIVLEGRLEKPPVQLNYLTICAHHLSTLLEGIEHFHEFTIRNPLTGLFTKAYLDEQIQHAWTLAKCQQFPIGLLSLDINEFRAINDQFGYTIGDQLLRMIANLITDHLQPTEIVARRGGDEFCVLMPATSADRAQSLAQILATAVENLHPVFNGITLNLTASVGFALTVESHGITSSSQLIECAEHARFVAKRTEGIHVSSWTQLKESGQASFNLHPVLVVDDDPQICVLINRLLNKNMYGVTGVGSVAEAVTLLEQGNRFELMLTDLALPHQDGTEMMRLAAEIDPEMVPVVISGNISKDSEQRLLQQGAFDIIKKPFSPEQLRGIVSKAIEQRTRSVRKVRKP
ncbi:MAG: response regulator [Kiritimatiellae bacterium]|nr:response regulator [Kiritimatiellia bacterium]